MLSPDSAAAAKQAARLVTDTRVRHFYDPKRQVGKSIALSFGVSDQVAWDVYLFYAIGEKWDKLLPQPIAWAHQLSDTWIDHYHHGADLEAELHKIAERLLTLPGTQRATEVAPEANDHE